MTDKFSYDSYAFPRWHDKEGTAIHCQLIGVKVHGTDIGGVPFLAASFDTEDHGREIFEAIKANQDKIPIQSYVPEPPPRPLTVKEQARKKVLTGEGVITVRVESAPELSGDYLVQPGNVTQMNNIILGLQAGMGFPSGTDILDYHDKNGATHPWPEDKFRLLVKAVSKYLYEMRHAAEGTADTIPSNIITIS